MKHKAVIHLKQITLRLPEDVYQDLIRRGDAINCSVNSMIMLLVHLGLKIYDGQAVIQVTQPPDGSE